MRILVLFSFLLLSKLVLSQNRKCGNSDSIVNYEHIISEILKLNDQIKDESGNIQFRDQITIPLVFHIFNIEGNNFQIGREEIYSILGNLNLHFNNLNPGLSKVPDRFKDLIGNPNLRFCIGYREIEGNIEEGIILKTTNIPDFLDQIVDNDQRRHKIKYTDHGGEDAWDTDNYINIWVSGSYMFDGKSVPPHLNGIVEEENGILLDINQFKKDNNAYVLTHELGHYFYLLHIWGNESNDCLEDDGIEDTPQQFSPYFGCPNGDEYSCGSYDMYMNYMDYTDQQCSIMFTIDQALFINWALRTKWSGLLESKTFCKNEEIDDIFENVTISMTNSVLAICKGTYIDSEISIEIFDVKGRLIDKSKINSLEYCYLKDILRYPTGIYLVRLTNKDVVDIRKIFIFGI